MDAEHSCSPVKLKGPFRVKPGRRKAGQSLSALPLISDVDLLGNCKCVIHLDTEVATRALDLTVPKEQLHRP
jgi:hypothetical protein